LINVNKKYLYIIKFQLKLIINEFNIRIKIYIYAILEIEPERIIFIFFFIYYKIGILDLLLLGYKQIVINKLIFKYITDNINKYFDLNNKIRKSFIYNFLAPRTK